MVRVILPWRPGGNGAVVIRRGAGAVRVHVLDLQRLPPAVSDLKGISQGLVFHHLPEVVAGFGHRDLGGPGCQGDRRALQELQRPQNQSHPTQ